MRLGRLLRWGRPGFLRRRLPYVQDVLVGPCRNAWFLARNPEITWLSFRVRQAIAQGEMIVVA